MFKTGLHADRKTLDFFRSCNVNEVKAHHITAHNMSNKRITDLQQRCMMFLDLQNSKQ